MKKPISHRMVKLLQDPTKSELLMEYLRNPMVRETKILLVEVDEDTLDIYESTPSVEKSEGEEAENFPINPDYTAACEIVAMEFKALWIDETENRTCFEAAVSAVMYAISTTRNSSGDRGRKEWPSEEEIFQWALKKSEPFERALLARQCFIEGAQWVINEMNQGQKSKS